MTPTEQIERLRQLEKAATPGPWWREQMRRNGANSEGEHMPHLVKYRWDDVPTWICELSNHKDAEANANFIAASRNLLPALLDVASAAAWLMEDTDDLDRIDKGFEKLAAALSRLGEVKP